MSRDFLLVRDYFASAKGMQEGYTLGTLSCDGIAVGNTCEDEDRHLELHPEAKIKGKTCIPRGRYRIVLSFSHRFGKLLPEVRDVPGFVGIRFHGGNTAEDSEGCILVGRQRTPTGVAICAPVVARIISLLQLAEDDGKECWLKVM